MSLGTITDQHNSLVVTGELNFTTVVSVWNQSLPLLEKYSTLHFDLVSVEVCNSAGVALMLEWIKYGKQHNKIVTFNHIPEQLNSIISVSGIKDFLSQSIRKDV